VDDPELHAYREWYEWVFSLDSVKRTLPDKDRYLAHIVKYADSSAQSKVANSVRRGVAAHEIDDDKEWHVKWGRVDYSLPNFVADVFDELGGRWQAHTGMSHCMWILAIVFPISKRGRELIISRIGEDAMMWLRSNHEVLHILRITCIVMPL
jgi:hypothetical protein